MGPVLENGNSNSYHQNASASPTASDSPQLNQQEEREREKRDLAREINANFQSAIFEVTGSVKDISSSSELGTSRTKGSNAVSLQDAVSEVGQSAYQAAMEIGAQLGVDADVKMQIAMVAKQHAEYIARGKAEKVDTYTTAAAGTESKKNNSEIEEEIELLKDDLQARKDMHEEAEITEEEQNRLAQMIGTLTVNQQFYNLLNQQQNQSQADRSELYRYALEYASPPVALDIPYQQPIENVYQDLRSFAQAM